MLINLFPLSFPRVRVVIRISEKNSKSAKSEIHPRDLQKENTFISLDQTLRSQQRAISHVLCMLTALSKGLKGD